MTAERGERLARIGLWVLLIGLWVVSLWYLWDALSDIAADPAEAAQLPAVPTTRTVYAVAAFSAIELAVVLALCWPWRSELYATRLAVAVLALATWLVSTMSYDMSRLDWVHRRWLGSMTITLAAALVLLLLYRFFRRSRPEAGAAIPL